MIGKWRDRFSSFVFFILIFKIRGCVCLNSEGVALFKLRMKIDSADSRALSDWKHDHAYPCSWSGVRCVNNKVYMLDFHGLHSMQSAAVQSKKSNSFVPKKGGIRAHFLEDAEDNQVENANSQHVLLFQDSRNLLAVPPNLKVKIQFTAEIIPSKSSGSFPAIPTSSPASPSPTPRSERGSGATTPVSEKSGISTKFLVGLSIGIFLVVVAASLLVICRSRAAKTIRPWKTGLSGQLRNAFITGVPKLKRSDLETACEDFSNIVIHNKGVYTVYKGTLSNGVEIAVASTGITCRKYWSRRAEIVFRKQIDAFSRINHKNFINLIGYCEGVKPFTRMMVFEYAPNGSLFEHLHCKLDGMKDMEPLDWEARMRIAMGVAYCLQHMHELNPSTSLSNLSSKCIFLTDDYATKIGDSSFWEEFINKPDEKLEHSEPPPVADTSSNVYSFGILLLELISGRLPEEDGHLINWASQYINNSKQMSCLVDQRLKSFKENELGIISEVIQSCTQQDFQIRPSMKEVVDKLGKEIDVSPAQAAPRLSPLWWAELGILPSETA